MDTIIGQLSDAAKIYGNKPYLVDKTDDGWVEQSFLAVDEQSRYLGKALHEIGLEKGQNIAILSEGTSRWVISEFALLFNGAASVPLSVKLLQEELPFRLNHSESEAIFVSKNHLEKLLKIWSQIEKENFYLIYLDEDVDFLKTKMAFYNVPLEKSKIYSQLMAKGKKSIFEGDNSEMSAKIKSIDTNDTVTISYTSGTTGNPKGIMLTHKNYVVNSADGVESHGLTLGMKSLIILPIDHCFAHTAAVYGALFCGVELYFLDARGGAINALKNIPINLNEVKPDFILTVPTLSGSFMKKITEGVAAKGGFVEKLFKAGLKAGLKVNKDGYSKSGLVTKLKNNPVHSMASKLIFSKLKSVFGGNLQFMVGGGALLDIKQQQFFYNIGIPILQGYGLTEASPVISANTRTVHKLGTSGKVLPTVNCKLMKEGGEECIQGEKGEIVIFGDSVMKGYFKNTEATDAAIKDGWLHTGDLGYYDKDGFLVVTGREKALLISDDGEKYSPEEIEEGLVYHSPLLMQGMVYNDHSRFTSAIITLDDGNVKRYIESEKITTTLQLYRSIEQEVKKFKTDPIYKSKFPNKWMPSVFLLAAENFNEDNKMMNSTMKMVRYKIEEVFKKDIQDIYSQKGAEVTKTKNIKVLQDKFNLA
ncbi:MAG: AMP-binding protein [Ichthyobacteriaceae bacterium]|nr:AMP-binding protein [Ichthyobacteriaceae bacterium]